MPSSLPSRLNKVTPEAQFKDQTWECVRRRKGDETVENHARFLQHQWGWAKELGMVDEGTNRKSEG